MTTDAILSVLLSVAIPFILAAMGGILAVRTTDEKFRYERWWWLVSFIGLALLGIVLAFVQQIVLTSEQKEADRKSEESRRQLESTTRFTQGQLDTMTKVLTVVASKGEPGISRDVVQALVTAVAPAMRADKTYPHNLSTKELRESTIGLVKTIRAFLGEYENREKSLFAQFTARKFDPSLTQEQQSAAFRTASEQEGQAYIALMTSEGQEFDARFKIDASLLREELLNRLPAAERSSTSATRAASAFQFINGNRYSLELVPDELERLAKQLPMK
jgi:hypothetical protein